MMQALCVGKPKFTSPAMASLAEREGSLAAWRQAFAEMGTKAAATVENDFAVAFEMPDGSVFMAVDKFSIHSLCYRIRDGRLTFALRADALADGNTDLDPQALFDYLYFHVIPSPRTIFKGVLRVPAGHCVLFRNGQLTVAPYWLPTFEEHLAQSFTELREEFRRTVEESVTRRIGTDKTGCYLSGGTDSSTVAGMLTKVTGRPAETYSIGFDVPGYDEMEYARIAARHFGTNHHEYYVTPDDLVAGIPKVAASFDQPFGNSSAVPAYYCALRARQDGIETLLAGDGGDELYGGNSRYAKQVVFGYYDHIPDALRHGLIEPALVDSGLFDRVPLVRKAASYVRQARVPMPDRMHTYNLLTHIGLEQIFSPDFLRQVDADSPARQQREIYAACPPTSLVNKMLAYDWRYTLAENDLPKVIGSATLAGVKVGFPLLDERVLALSLKLPTSYKLKGLKLRWFFKQALRGFLPDQIITKKKHGFGLPFGAWASSHDALRGLATDALQSIATRNLVRGDFVRTLLDTHLPAHPGFYGELVWILTMLEHWLRGWRPDYRLHRQ